MVIRRCLKANPALAQNLNQILGRRAVATDYKELQINYLPSTGYPITTDPLNFRQRWREVKYDGALRELSRVAKEVSWIKKIPGRKLRPAKKSQVERFVSQIEQGFCDFENRYQCLAGKANLDAKRELIRE